MQLNWIKLNETGVVLQTL